MDTLPASVVNHTLVRQYFDYVENFEYNDSMPLSNPVYPLATSAIYLVLVYFLNWVMRKSSKPLPIEWLVAIHNFILFVASLLMFLGMGFHLFVLYSKLGYYELLCDTKRAFVSRGGLFFWVYIFYLSKYYELLDTIFLCLRKKPLLFLHVYHHAITLLLIYSCLQCDIPIQWVAEILNAFVHTPMYFYYLIASFGIQPWWKRYLTQIQIIQFILVLVHQAYVNYVYFYLKEPCHAVDTFGSFFGSFVVSSYLVLFILFYKRAYREGGAKGGRAKKD